VEASGRPHSEVTGTLFERDTVRYLSGFGDRVKIARRGRGNPITDTDLKVEASASR